MYNGYLFYFECDSDVLTFPITPSELSINVGSKNKVVTLISEGDINILKSPSLTEIEFEARFPMRQYPYARPVQSFVDYYFEKFKDLKVNRKPFHFIVARSTPDGIPTWDTDILVALEELELKESVDEGDDVIIKFSLKQYKEYGVKKLNNSNNTTSTSNSDRSTAGKDTKSSVYTVKSGDCLWNIAKAAYGKANRALVDKIYKANSEAIEADARKHGRSSSSDGHWIYPGLKLTIPDITNASSLKVKKLW